EEAAGGAVPATHPAVFEARGDVTRRLEGERDHELRDAQLTLARRHAMDLDEDALPSRPCGARLEGAREDVDRRRAGRRSMTVPAPRGPSAAPRPRPLARGHRDRS